MPSMQEDPAIKFSRLWAGVEPALKTVLWQRFKEDPQTAEEVQEGSVQESYNF
jgi:hypothetical protein